MASLAVHGQEPRRQKASPVFSYPVLTEMRVLYMAAKQGPNVLLWMPNRTKFILLVSLRVFSPLLFCVIDLKE
jgi:hypothetical protein